MDRCCDNLCIDVPTDFTRVPSTARIWCLWVHFEVQVFLEELDIRGHFTSQECHKASPNDPESFQKCSREFKWSNLINLWSSLSSTNRPSKLVVSMNAFVVLRLAWCVCAADLLEFCLELNEINNVMSGFMVCVCSARSCVGAPKC
jgi:hypothetical protein